MSATRATSPSIGHGTYDEDSTMTELQAAEQRLKTLICDHAPTPHIGTMIWIAAHAYAKACRHAERDRLLADMQRSS